MDTTIVSVNHLSKSFQHITAVDDLSFTVPAGEIYGFLGQNGAGKSTTMRMMLSLIRPSSGSIQLFGKSLTDNRKFILQRVGAMIERPDLYKYLSAYDNLKIFAQLSDADDSRAALMKQLAKVGLEKRASDKVGGFSQGMKQRLGIAIALVHNPQLVILDEPSNGLDPQGIVDIRNLILQLNQEEQKTIIVSSHLLNEMEQVASSILIVDKGKKIVEGKTRDLIDPAQTQLTLMVDDAHKAQRALGDTKFPPLRALTASQLECAIARKDIPLLNQALVEKGIQVYSIQQMNNLEKYFLQQTGPSYAQSI